MGAIEVDHIGDKTMLGQKSNGDSSPAIKRGAAAQAEQCHETAGSWQIDAPVGLP